MDLETCFLYIEEQTSILQKMEKSITWKRKYTVFP